MSETTVQPAPSGSSPSSCSALVEAIKEMNRHIEALSLNDKFSPQLDRASSERVKLVAALIEVRPNSPIAVFRKEPPHPS